MALSSPTVTLPQTPEAPVNSGDRVSDLIQKLVAAATAEVESAAQRSRAEAQAEITQLQKTVDRLRDELHSERDWLKVASAELTLAREAASHLKQELETERAAKARFAATLETVRLLVTETDPEQRGPDPGLPPTGHIAEADDEPGGHRTVPDPFAEFQTVDLKLATRQPPPPVAAQQSAASPLDSSGHIAQLLAQVEEIYRSDLKSAEGTSEVVARLAANLAYARDALARRLDSTDGDEARLFDRHLSMLIDSRSGTPFGRHLAMAVRFSVVDRPTSAELQEEAS
jgi:hypothetical protein